MNKIVNQFAAFMQRRGPTRRAVVEISPFGGGAAGGGAAMACYPKIPTLELPGVAWRIRVLKTRQALARRNAPQQQICNHCWRPGEGRRAVGGWQVGLEIGRGRLFSHGMKAQPLLEGGGAREGAGAGRVAAQKCGSGFPFFLRAGPVQHIWAKQMRREACTLHRPRLS